MLLKTLLWRGSSARFLDAANAGGDLARAQSLRCVQNRTVRATDGPAEDLPLITVRDFQLYRGTRRLKVEPPLRAYFPRVFSRYDLPLGHFHRHRPVKRIERNWHGPRRSAIFFQISQLTRITQFDFMDLARFFQAVIPDTSSEEGSEAGLITANQGPRSTSKIWRPTLTSQGARA